MGAFDLAALLWPDADQGRQPQGAVGMAADWGANCLAAYPVLGLGRESANGGKRFIGIADSGLYAPAIGRAGLAFSGNGAGIASTKGLYTAPGAIPYSELSAMSEFVVFELSSTSCVYESTLVRATSNRDASGVAIALFPYQKWIRVLFNTTGTTGWSASYDITDYRMAAGVLWGIGVSYISGRRVVYSGPIGGEMLATVTTAITGIIRDTNSINGALFVGGQDYTGSYSNAFPGKIYTASFWRGAKTRAEFEALFANPWQVFAPQPIPFSLESSGIPAGAELAGNAQVQATVTGTLTLQAALEGAALSVTTASGSISTQIPLVGAAVAVASASGQLLTSIPLTAAALAQVLAAGNLSAQIRLDGAALAQVAASAGLTSAILLAGNVQAETTASGTLAADPGGLVGDVHAQTTVVATLTTSIRLSGSAAVQAGVSGVLTTNIPLTAAALATAIATGSLTTQILLAGDVAAISTASGTLSTQPIDAPGVNYRLNASVRRLTTMTHTSERLTRASTAHRRLTTLTHGVRHA